MDTQGHLEGPPTLQAPLDRRSVNRSIAWAVPAIMAVAAAPAATGSTTPVTGTADPGQGDLTHTHNQSYTLTLFFTVTGPVGATVPIAVTDVSTTTVPGPVEFTVVPQTVNVPVGVNSAIYTFIRNGNNSALTASVTYSVNGGAFQTVSVPVVM